MIRSALMTALLFSSTAALAARPIAGTSADAQVKAARRPDTGRRGSVSGGHRVVTRTGGKDLGRGLAQIRPRYHFCGRKVLEWLDWR